MIKYVASVDEQNLDRCVKISMMFVYILCFIDSGRLILLNLYDSETVVLYVEVTIVLLIQFEH